MSNENITLVSLGMSCQTTHQLRRLTSYKSHHSLTHLSALAGPFDWLICPLQSTIQLLNHRLPDFTTDSISIKKGRAYWHKFNLYFWHSFLVEEGEHRHVDIDRTFENELSRWRYLRDRFASVNPKKTVFVLSNTQNNLQTEVFTHTEKDQFLFTTALLEELHRSLAIFYSTTTNKIHLEVLTRKERMRNFTNSNEVYFLPNDHNEWKGSNRSWDQWSYQLQRLVTDNRLPSTSSINTATE